MKNPTTTRRSVTPLVWGSSVAAALLLVLGVTGTLSSWTQAIINNDTNTTTAASAVALSEANSTGVVCVDTASTTTNSATCSTINKYGGGTLNPDGTNTATTSVTLKNTGSGSGTLTLDAGTCTKSGGITGSTGNLCDQVNVKVECPAGTVKVASQTLNAFDAATPATISTLAAGASVTCAITVTLPANTAPSVASQTAAQPLTWKLA